MKRFRLLWSAPPWQAVAEAWLIGVLILLILAQMVGLVSPFALSNGTLFLCGASGMWAVLRTRLGEGHWLRRTGRELLIGLALSAVMAVGLRLPAWLLGWERVWTQSRTDIRFATLLLLGTGVGYVAMRGAVAALRVWNRLRRRRMLWALTHAHLMIVVLAAVIIAVVVFASALYSSVRGSPQPASANWWATFITWILVTAFPALSLMLVLTVVTLLVLLPPSALFSLLVARRTTHRIEDLAAAARAFQKGEYQERVTVAGEDEVAQLQASFNAMAGDLQRTLQDLQAQRDAVAQLLQSRRELVASVSHELRTPVATVRAALEAAQDNPEGPLPPQVRRDLETMEGEVLRLQRLLDDLFTLSRAEVGQLALTCRPTDVAPIARRMVEALAPWAWNTGRVEMVAELPADLPPACVDEARLEQILANILRNAVYHTPPGGIVAVTASAEESTVRLEVRDTGEGIAPQDLPHIWERFYRGQGRQEEDGGGAGLGLALVKELSEAMGGSVAVESVVGQGSCFAVRLPRA